MLTAIIVAGGSSRRMGFDKTFAMLGEMPVVAHSIAAFEATKAVAEIIVVGREERLAELQKIIAEKPFQKIRHVVAGGEQRQDSVRQGLSHVAADCDFIAVHDAARPLVRATQIEMVFDAAQRHGAASLAAPVTDTLKRATTDRIVCGSVEREGIYAMQTPQIFARQLLLQAYEAVAAINLLVTDEVSAVENIGHAVVLVPADDYNFKITFPADLALAEMVQRQRRATH